MALPQLTVYRHDRDTHALITLAGEIDLATVPLVRASLTACLHGGMRTVDVDLTAVTFCDVTGLNAFLSASQLADESGATLRLHRPSRMTARVIAMTGSGFLLPPLHEPPPAPRPKPRAAHGPSYPIPALPGGAL